MIWFVLLIPILTILILLIFFRKDVQWWEYLLVAGPDILLIVSMNYFMIQSRTSDIEYLGYDVVSIKYYEDWDEWITRTCYYETCSGSGSNRTCTTHSYDCSYRKYHPEYWVMVASNGDELGITQDYYKYLQKKFATPIIFVDMSRDFYKDDGDMYKNEWDGSILKAHSVTRKHDYENKIKASHSIFKIEDLTPEEVKRWKLYDYPVLESHAQDFILGYNQNESINNKLHYLNGCLATKHQIQTFVLIFKNQPKSVAFKQRSHWEGGNKNELLVCIGIDSLTNTVQWSKSFSWMDVPTLAVGLDSYISSQNTLDINATVDYLIQKVPSDWHRKSFHDFDYLQIEVTATQLGWIIFTVLLINVGISWWVVMNEF